MSERSLLVRFGADLSDLEKAVGKAAKAVGKVGGQMEKLGKELTASVTAPLVGLGAAAIAASETIDDAMDTIRASTGATGDRLDTLSKSFNAVFATVPDSADKVAQALSGLSLKTGATGESLESMAAQMLNLSRLSKTEVEPLIQSTQKAFQNWGIEADKQSSALDMLWKVSQSTGIGFTTLTDALSGGGAVLRSLGYDFESSAALMGMFEKAGIDSGEALAGLTKVANEAAKSGGFVEGGFQKMIADMKAMKDPADAAAAASDAFGKKAVMMADAIQRGTFDMAAFQAQIAASPETINKAAADTAGLGEALASLRNAATLALAPLGVELVNTFIRMMPVFQGLISIVNAVVGAFAAMPSGVQTGIIALAGIAAATGPALLAFGAIVKGAAGVVGAALGLKAGILAAVPAMSAAWAALAAAAASGMAMLGGAFGAAAGAVGPIVGVLGSVGTALLSLGTPVGVAVAALALVALNWDRVKAAASSAATYLGSALSSAWANIKSATATAWRGIWDLAVKGVDMAIGAAKGLGSMLASVGSALGTGFWDAVSSAFTKVTDFAKGIFSSLKSGIESAVSSAIGALNSLLSTASGIVSKIISMVSSAVSSMSSAGSKTAGGGASSSTGSAPQGSAGSFGYGAEFGGGGGYGTGTIPAMADGGIVNGATLAMIGEAGPEAVIPLDRLNAMMAGSGGGGITVNLFVSGSVATERNLAEGIRRQLVRVGQRNGSTGVV